MSTYTELQLDALRELANIGSGTASTALSTMIGRSDRRLRARTRRRCRSPTPSTPPARPSARSPASCCRIVGELDGTVLLLVPPADADAHVPHARRRARHRVRRSRRSARSATSSARSYLNALAAMTGLDDRARPRRRRRPTCSARSSRRVLAGHARRGRRRAAARLRPARSRARTAPSPSCSSPTSGGRRRAARPPRARADGGQPRPWCAWASSPCRGSAGDVLVSIGLGSCIGLALLDRRAGVAGLAHVMLPATRGGQRQDARASSPTWRCPALLERVLEQLGAAPGAPGGRRSSAARDVRRLGSAASTSARATRPRCARALRAAAHPDRRPTATGGTTGRTIRVHVGRRPVTAREAGGARRSSDCGENLEVAA